MKYTFFFLFTICLSNAQQQQKITTKDFNFIGKVKSVLETAEKEGDLITEKEKNNNTVINDDSFFPIISQHTFNELGNIVEKRELPNLNRNFKYIYDSSNKLMVEKIYISSVEDTVVKLSFEIKYSYKDNCIIKTKNSISDATEKPVEITSVYKKNKLIKEYNEQKVIVYSYDKQGTLIKKEAWKKDNPKNKKVVHYQVTYENGNVISNFCLEEKSMKVYYPNGLLKSYKTEYRFQENVYTFDKNGNWITNTVTLDGKPSIKYYRIVDYFE
jgi:hypothetical protein